ncbi:MAG: hypothetical protein QGG53_09810 [Planctomycetota bacterium]|jgi:hypothetical protein|nr:hypothetical protein [Planctomycetota bacterium]
MFFTDPKEMNKIRGTVYNRPPVTFDPILSYRWNPGIRVVRVAQGEIVFDSSPKINNEGFHCSYDYHREKRERTFRFIVLGDSFTNDLAVDEAWPETVQHLLRSRPEHATGIEIYGMPTDGGGLPNWYSTLKEYLLPHFEFDGLLIADWGDDLARQWVVSHSNEESMFWDRVDIKERPGSLEEVESNLGNMPKLCEVKTDSEIDQLVSQLKQHANPKSQTPDECEGNVELAPEDFEFSPAQFTERYSPDRFDMLSEMVELCREHSKVMVYSPLPTRSEVLHLIQNPAIPLFRQSQGEGLCRHFGIHYFDGCSVFNHINPRTLIDLYWLKYDGHWSKAASLQYALALAEWMTGLMPFACGCAGRAVFLHR